MTSQAGHRSRHQAQSSRRLQDVESPRHRLPLTAIPARELRWLVCSFVSFQELEMGPRLTHSPGYTRAHEYSVS